MDKRTFFGHIAETGLKVVQSDTKKALKGETTEKDSANLQFVTKRTDFDAK